MKKLNLFVTTLLAVSISLTPACGDDDSDSSSTPVSNGNGGGNGGGINVNKYSGSASYGDLVTFSIDQDNQSYVLTNETTGNTETGNYEVSTDSLFRGVYKVEANTETFFGIELDDKLVTANFPSGNSNNDISFGVSSEIDNSGKLNQIAGDYFYVKLGSYLSQGEPMEWGVFTASTDSLWGVYVDNGDNGPEDTIINRPLNYNNNHFTGNSFDFAYSINNDRIDIIGDGQNMTGYVYVSGNTSVFLIDQGTGLGTFIAYKIDDNFNLANAIGDYKFIDFSTNGEKGAGNFKIDINGDIAYSWTDGTIGNTDLNVDLLNPLVVSNIPNVWYAENINADQENLYVVIAGDAIMHYLFDVNYNFIGYGAGAKL